MSYCGIGGRIDRGKRIVWTPRRILLLLLGLIAFGAIYLVYAQFLGNVDGLPQLPAALLEPRDGPAPPLRDRESPTVTRLKEAFGPNCPEVQSAYPTRIEMREDGIVFAAGRPDLGNEASKFVRLAPFSLAMFAKPRLPHERAPGEVTEITTLHADEAILELDKVIGSEREMLTGKAKIVGMELRTAPDPFTARTDPRNGRVHITNNQRSADANRAFVFKTPGPVFYRTHDHPDQANTNGPNIWTSASVEIVNRENLPRPIRGSSLPTVSVAADEEFRVQTIADMAFGLHTPPPTITADGMKIYLKKPKTGPPVALAPNAKPTKELGFQGVREMTLSENVIFSLWTDGKSGFPGSTTPEPTPAAPGKKAVVVEDPPAAMMAIMGGIPDGVAISNRIHEKALVRIHTLGPFRFDWEKNEARFDAAAISNPLVPNNVEVTRINVSGTRDHLICQVLEIEFQTALMSPATAQPKSNGPAFKTLRATGTSVYLAAESDQLQAQCQSIIYENDPKKFLTRTILSGSPLIAVRQRNRLEAGRAGQIGRLLLETYDPPATAKIKKTTRIEVLGPGKIDMFDEETKTTTLTAIWRDSLTQTVDKIGTKEVDLLTFAGDASFADPKSGFDLRADTLRLWLEQPAPGKEASNAPARPSRLQGIGHVNGRSADTNIRDTDHFMTWFKDVPKPVRPVPNAPASQTVSRPATPAPVPLQKKPELIAAMIPTATPGPFIPPFVDPTAKIEQLPPKPKPMDLSARSIEVWVMRYPADPRPAVKGAPPAKADAVQYELESAICDGRVIVKQDPIDPAKQPNGLLITGAYLTMNHYVNGHVMKVVGTQDLLAEVHFEDIKIAGPDVVIDQPNNSVAVKGKGWLKMPSSSDLSGAAITERSDLTVLWQERMNFRGERRFAEFTGLVQAVQQPPSKVPAKPVPGTIAAEPTWSRSYVLCHHLDVGFDRPIYFNQMKQNTPAKPRATPTTPNAPNPDDPKIERVICEPIPEDAEAVLGKPRPEGDVYYVDETFESRSGKTVKAQRIKARLLEVRVKDDRSLILATGPGETRGLQMSAKDDQPQPTITAPAPTKPKEEELKLTIVQFAGRLDIEDRKSIFQKAVFRESIVVFNLPTDNLNLKIEAHNVPPKTVVMQCTDTLTATSYKDKAGAQGEQKMIAEGDARVRTDEYYGLGHIIKYDGSQVILEGYADGQATLYRRQTGVGREKDYKSGNPLVYNTKTGQVSGSESSGGTFSNTK